MGKKIYTKKGDQGFTSLLSGKRIPKTDQRIDGVGVLDELNSFIGLFRTEWNEDPLLEQIQWNLFNAGSIIIKDTDKFNLVEVTENDVEELEKSIDKMDITLPELKNFILPKGNKAICLAHICRTICRRAERICYHTENEIIIKFLNRLSDYFFVVARYISHQNGITEKIWKN
jgi:cob(I)alamin adenosyltransferase